MVHMLVKVLREIMDLEHKDVRDSMESRVVKVNKVLMDNIQVKVSKV